MSLEISILFIGVIIVASFILIYILRMKVEIRNISKQLNNFKNNETKKNITISFCDNDIENLATEINELFDDYRKSTQNNKAIEATVKMGISNIVHDLRTPLTIIIGYINLIKVNEIELNQGLKIIDEKARFIQDIINDFFQMVSESNEKLQLEALNIAGIIQDELLSFYDEFEKKGINISITIEAERMMVMGEKTSIQRVVQNLIANALKYGEKYIEVRLTNEEKTARLMVINRCQYLDRNYLDFIFDRLYIADKNRADKGTGLGLAIVKSLMSKMGGNVKAEMEADKLIIICNWNLC